ncbi:MAG: alpha-amylase [Bacteroidales bacterium]|nr:alpha-amylase [Bacteroidales bacterium]
MKTNRLLLTLMCSLALFSCTSREKQKFIASQEEIEKYLHVPSPEWEDQIIYFIVTDRFMDGDTTNNDQGAGEYKPGDGGYWNGGDFRGITQKIDYIKELGATGIWITPPVANQWINPQKSGTGNHGYWASSFIDVDKHYGSLDDYKQLSASLHKNDMYLIQDVVVNHLGDFYTYTGPYNPNDVTENFKVHDVPQPTQYPFMHNDANNPEDREMAIFHFTPNFQDHSDTIKKRMYQFADLDDLNTANPVVRKVLRSSYNHWIGEVGVDGFRFDTPHMVEHEFWHNFIHSEDAEAPGVEKFAIEKGKQHFLTFGETVYPTFPYDDSGDKKVARYLGSKNKPEMQSVLNFPLVATINRVFQEQRPTSLMTYRLESLERLFPHPEWMLNFIDNHDGARFLTQASHSSFRQALLFIMTIPGIPVLYYGTEQELTGTRQAMFKGGAGSLEEDRFITDNESFRFLQDLIRIRKENDAFRRGELKVLRDATGGPGVFIYELYHQDESVFVMLNTSESEKWADNIPTGLEQGTLLKSFFSLSGEEIELTVDKEGNVNALLGAREGVILIPAEETGSVVPVSGTIKIDPMADHVISAENLTVSGMAEGFDRLGLIIDGDYSSILEVVPGGSGNWSAEIPLHNLSNGTHRITALGLLDTEIPSVADFIEFELELPAVLGASIKDIKGDDNGPEGKYNYPAHPSYQRQMDIELVKVYTTGTNLRVDVTMGQISRIWLPPNTFDHALINIFIDLPGREGVQALPFQNADMPDGGAWDYLVSTAGFGNAIYSSEGASATNTGKATGPAAMVSSDLDSRTITFMIASEALGNPLELRGSKIYITTWDGSPGNPRELKPEAENWAFSGGINSEPKIMDDTELIILE